MTGLAFFDTNVLVYSDDAGTPAKQGRAIALYAEHRRRGAAVISLQVLEEYFVTVTRKLGVDAKTAQQKVENLSRSRLVRLDGRDIVAAIELHRLEGISFWDALVVHAARIAGAAVLYSEDFAHGSLVAGVRVVNPFLEV